MHKRMAKLEAELDKAKKLIEIQSELAAALGARKRERGAWAAMMVYSTATELAPLGRHRGSAPGGPSPSHLLQPHPGS